MNHDATHCLDFCADCPFTCYRTELEVDLRSRWREFIGVPLSYAHLYGTVECKRGSYQRILPVCWESEVGE